MASAALGGRIAVVGFGWRFPEVRLMGKISRAPVESNVL